MKERMHQTPPTEINWHSHQQRWNFFFSELINRKGVLVLKINHFLAVAVSRLCIEENKNNSGHRSEMEYFCAQLWARLAYSQT